MPCTTPKRVVIVTGSSRGIGREIAFKFGKTGCRVVVNFLMNEEAAEAVADEINRAGGEAVHCKADVRLSDEVNTMIDTTAKRWGSIDVLINNAGIAKDGLILRMSEQSWDEVIETNLTGAFHCIRAASKVMTKQRHGHIINISSIAGIQGRQGQANYSSAKAGLIGLTKSCAKELGCFNINVNAVLPGYLPTDMGETVSDSYHESIMRENALHRTSAPEEVAEFVHGLSLMNSVSGQVFNLDSRIL